ncbi:MAG TPA: amidohydrolase family protein [Actinomycetota bacterium]|nr:amidohydrolase family protein [Actinomycetota bacterium]
MSDHRPTSIRAGRLVDVVAGDVLRAQVLTIRGDRIEAVEPDEGTYPPDARVLDLSSHTVLPGLIDCHAHLIGDVDSGHGYAGLVQSSAAQEVLFGVRNARMTLDAGFTTVRDVGSFRAFTDVALRHAIDEGWTPGPRMMCAGAFVTCPGGGGDVTGLAVDVDEAVPRELRFGVAKSADEVRDAARRILHGGADLIKVIATGAVLTEGTTPSAPEFSEAEIRAAVEEAALYGAHVAAHAHGAEGIKRAVRAGVRSIEHGSYADDEAIELMAEHGTYLVADVWMGDWCLEQGRNDGWSPTVMRKMEDSTIAQREVFARAVKAGVKQAFGTDSGVYPHGMGTRQFATMVGLGMSPMEAIRSGTIVAAELMGWEDRVGSLQAGRYADLVAVEGDPLEDLDLLNEVALVMKGGEVIRAA